MNDAPPVEKHGARLRAAWRTRLQRLTLRRGMLLLLLIAMLPVTILSLAQGLLRLERERMLIDGRLSENALAAAGTERNVVAGAQAVLRMLSVNPDIAGGGPRCADLLSRTLPEFPIYSNFAVIRSDGSVICSALPVVQPADFSSVGWWKELQATRGFTVSEPVIGNESRRRVLIAALPLRAAGGGFDGAVALGIDMEALSRSLQARYVGRDAVIALLDGRGRALLTSRSEPLPAFVLGGRPGVVRQGESDDGRRWSYAVAPLLRPGAPGGLYIAYAAPQLTLFTRSWLYATADFLLPFMTIGFAAAAIWFGTDRLVVRWLRALRSLATAFARGEYRAREADFAPAPAEMRSVAASLRRMAHAIEERDNTLLGSVARQRKLAREVHHRVKNNLQIVMSLLSLQAGRLKDGEGRRALELARNRISALALVHRLLYETDEAAQISARRLLGEVASQLQLTHRPPVGVKLAGDFADVPISIDTAVPLTLWLVETLSNAFRYAFPPGRGGLVQLRLSADDERLRLSIVDDGVGFDLPLALQRRPASNGLRLIQATGQQLGGTVSIETAPDQGTRILLDFPRPELREVDNHL